MNSTFFADAFNYYIYGGQQVINPAQLRSLDPAELGILHGSKDKIETKDLIEKYRDLLKMASLMVDQTAVYLLLGIENQGCSDYVAVAKTVDSPRTGDMNMTWLAVLAFVSIAGIFTARRKMMVK